MDKVLQQFYEAVLWNDITAAEQMLLEDPTLLNMPTPWGETALMAAAGQGHIELLNILLQSASCDINAATQEGLTALHYAARWKKLDSIVILLRHGADLLARDIHNQTALNLALYNKDTEAAELMLNSLDKSDEKVIYSLLHAACTMVLPGIVEKIINDSSAYFKINGTLTLRHALLLTQSGEKQKIISLLISMTSLDFSCCSSFGRNLINLALYLKEFDAVRDMMNHPDFEWHFLWSPIDSMHKRPLYYALPHADLLRTIIDKLPHEVLLEHADKRLSLENSLLDYEASWPHQAIHFGSRMLTDLKNSDADNICWEKEQPKKAAKKRRKVRF
jgi:ankyrin repeat protein